MWLPHHCAIWYDLIAHFLFQLSCILQCGHQLRPRDSQQLSNALVLRCSNAFLFLLPQYPSFAIFLVMLPTRPCHPHTLGCQWSFHQSGIHQRILVVLFALLALLGCLTKVVKVLEFCFQNFGNPAQAWLLQLSFVYECSLCLCSRRNVSRQCFISCRSCLVQRHWIHLTTVRGTGAVSHTVVVDQCLSVCQVLWCMLQQHYDSHSTGYSWTYEQALA